MRLLLLAMLALAGALTFALGPAAARWKPEYASASPETRAWYETRNLNPETRTRLGVGWTSCCNHSDVVKTKFRVNRVDGGDEWYWLDPATNAWRRVPPDTIHWHDPAPSGEPTLFVYDGKETCFFPAEGGL